MKTRRKTTKTPAKGRRTSVICVMKSPIGRKNNRRNPKNTVSTAKLSVYESPLKHLRHNGPEAPSKTSVKIDTPSKSPVKTEMPLRRQVKAGTSFKSPVKTESPLKDVPHTSTTNSGGKKYMRSGLVVKDIKKLLQNPDDYINMSVEVNSTNESLVDTSQPMPNENSESTSASSSNRKKRNIYTCIKEGITPVSKRRKLKKSPLSKLNESADSNKLSDSVILVEDSETESICNQSVKSEMSIQSLKNEDVNQSWKSETSNLSFKSEGSNQSSKSEKNKNVKSKISETTKTKNEKSKIPDAEKTKNEKSKIPVAATTKNEKSKIPDAAKMKNEESRSSETAKTSDDVVVIVECSETSMVEMESYHHAFSQEEPQHSPPPDNLLDSVIVIEDQDDDDDNGPASFPMPLKNPVTKPNEDCFVVWSSYPQPSTSTSETQSSKKNTWLNNNADILKNDKILLDTNPDASNLRFLNNQNSRPTMKKLTKSPKITKNTFKRPLTKTTVLKSKIPATKVVTKTTSKATTSTTVKKTTTNNGEASKVGTSTAKTSSKKGKLRQIVIDGSNCGMAHTNNKVFSEKGIKLLIDYFTKKGHTVKVFVPQHKRSRNHPLLEKWYEDGIVVFTPSRKLGNKSFTPYDDRYILNYATDFDAVVVSQDQFRDLYAEEPKFKKTIENRILVPTFVGDYVMFPEDPLGRNGPSLAEFLRH